MSSESTRSEIVLKALSRAGRGVELKSDANQWLNDVLRSEAIHNKYPQLRKIGAAATLSAGSFSASLPVDFGFGMESILFGDERIVIREVDIDEFADLGGFNNQTRSTGRPTYYYIDKDGGLIQFSVAANQNYSYVPVFYKIPAKIDISSAGDNTTVWFDDDDLIVEMLIEKIYQFTGDDREFTQSQKVRADARNFRRGISGMQGGGSAIKLSKNRFRRGKRN